MSKKKQNKTHSENKKMSQDTKVNLIITLGVILFILVICFLVYLVIIDNNPNAFKDENEITNNTITTTATDDAEKEQLSTTPNFNLVAENISISGKLPKLMESKFYLECFDDASINIYSKYTYALSKSRDYEEEKGIILTIRIVKEEDLPRVEELEGKYAIIDKIDDYQVIAVVPKTTQYITDDDVSKSNYDRLSQYRQEIIDSVTVTKVEEGVENAIVNK